MHQIPNPGDGFLAPPSGVRYVLTFEELCITGKTMHEAVEQWMLARNAHFDVRFRGCEEVPGALAGGVTGYLARRWQVTMHTPWHVYTVTTPDEARADYAGPRGFWRALEEVCRTIDRLMLEEQSAVDMRKDGSPI